MNAFIARTRPANLRDTAATFGIAVVTGSSFVASWHGLTALASATGLSSISATLPLSVDGLQISASMLILNRQALGLPARSAWAAVILATALSSAGNAAAAPDTALARIIFGCLPVLLAIGTHFLTQQMSTRTAIQTAAASQPIPAAKARRSTRQATAPSQPIPDPIHATVDPIQSIPAPTLVIHAEPVPAAMDSAQDREALLAATLDRLHASGETIGDWRRVLAAEPALAGMYSRPDRVVPRRIEAWRLSVNSSS